MIVNIQIKRWVTFYELMFLLGYKTRGSVYKLMKAGLPVHHLLPPKVVAFDVVEVVNWCQRNGRALPLTLALHVKNLNEVEGEGKSIKYDEALTEIARGNVARAPRIHFPPFSSRLRSRKRGLRAHSKTRGRARGVP
jgi:hypothetical protein